MFFLSSLFTEVQCDHPESTKDGFIEVSNFKGSYVYGSRATYHCNPGFILWGEQRREEEEEEEEKEEEEEEEEKEEEVFLSHPIVGGGNFAALYFLRPSTKYDPKNVRTAGEYCHNS